jgi:hypothetical protein
MLFNRMESSHVSSISRRGAVDSVLNWYFVWRQLLSQLSREVAWEFTSHRQIRYQGQIFDILIRPVMGPISQEQLVSGVRGIFASWGNRQAKCTMWTPKKPHCDHFLCCGPRDRNPYMLPARALILGFNFHVSPTDSPMRPSPR